MGHAESIQPLPTLGPPGPAAARCTSQLDGVGKVGCLWEVELVIQLVASSSYAGAFKAYVEHASRSEDVQCKCSSRSFVDLGRAHSGQGCTALLSLPIPHPRREVRRASHESESPRSPSPLTRGPGGYVAGASQVIATLSCPRATEAPREGLPKGIGLGGTCRDNERGRQEASCQTPAICTDAPSIRFDFPKALL